MRVSVGMGVGNERVGSRREIECGCLSESVVVRVEARTNVWGGEHVGRKGGVGRGRRERVGGGWGRRERMGGGRERRERVGGSGLSAAHITLLGKTESKTSALINFTLVTDFSLSLISPEFRVFLFFPPCLAIMDRMQ